LRLETEDLLRAEDFEVADVLLCLDALEEREIRDVLDFRDPAERREPAESADKYPEDVFRCSRRVAPVLVVRDAVAAALPFVEAVPLRYRERGEGLARGAPALRARGEAGIAARLRA